MVDPDFGRLLAGLGSGRPASHEEISTAEAVLGRPFPEHYREFLSSADGCEGTVGDHYIALWPVGALAELNDAFSVDDFAPGLLLIGSDGAGTAFALDLRRDPAPIVAIPFVPMELDDSRDVGGCVFDVLKALEAG